MWIEFSLILLWLIVIAIIVIGVILYIHRNTEFNKTGPTGPQGLPGIASNTGATGPIGLPGSNKSYITFNSGGFYVDQAFQFYGFQQTNGNLASIVMSESGTLSNLYVDNVFPNNGAHQGTMTFTVTKNFIDTALSVTMPVNASTVSNTSSITFVSGDVIAIIYKGTVTNNLGRMTLTVTT
jgi:hypothetical protein